MSGSDVYLARNHMSVSCRGSKHPQKNSFRCTCLIDFVYLTNIDNGNLFGRTVANIIIVIVMFAFTKIIINRSIIITIIYDTIVYYNFLLYIYYHVYVHYNSTCILPGLC